MARWAPPEKIEKSEYLGRRLFQEPKLRGADGQREFKQIPFTHFQETRDRKTSLDRLGKTNVDKKVRNYLIPLAEASGRKFQKTKPFEGWAVVQAKHLEVKPDGKDCKLEASPVTEPEDEKNEYHAHIERPVDVGDYMMALHLREIFWTKGRMEQLLRETRFERVRKLALSSCRNAWTSVRKFFQRSPRT